LNNQNVFSYSSQADNDANSCYYSASHTEHTDNYYSTDEHENLLHHTKLHSSDSGADLSEKNILEKHMESISDEYHRRNSRQHDDEITEDDDARADYHHERNNSLPELFHDDEHVSGWEKYWSKNGERLIWQSWIEKYIDYINPEYLGKDGVPPFEGEPSSAFNFDISNENRTEIVISPPPLHDLLTADDLFSDGWNPLSPASTACVSSKYQHYRRNESDNLLSPRCESVNSSIPMTIGGTTDSMTNVTRMTISSFDFGGSSRVSSESTPTSTPTDSNSVSSFSDSEESDNPMTTRLSADCEKLLKESKNDGNGEHIPPPTGNDPEEYWQKRWQGHAQEQYVKHYNEFMEAHRMLQQEMSNSFKSDSGFLPGEGNSGKFNKHKRKRSSRKKNTSSLQRLVANLNLKSEIAKFTEPEDATEPPTDASDHPDQSDSTVVDTAEASMMQALGLPSTFGRSLQPSKSRDDDGDDDPPEDRAVTLKRSHESDTEEPNVDRIKSHFELMGFAFTDPNSTDSTTVTAGDIVYRKKHVRLHNRMLKMMPSVAVKPKHTYFDDDGNEVNDGNLLENEMILHTSSDEDGPPIPPSSRINIPFTSQLSSDANPSEEGDAKSAEVVNINLSIDENEPNCLEENVMDEDKPSKKEKKKKRKGKFQSSVPVEIANDKTLKKFWYKRFSLFSMFDHGVRLDRGKD
jgi:trimethylguanosine synthase